MPEVGKRSLGVQRRFLETKFEGVEFVIQLLLLGLNLEISLFITPQMRGLRPKWGSHVEQAKMELVVHVG